MQDYGIIAFKHKIYKRKFSAVDSSLQFALTDCPASYFAAQTPFELQSRLLQQNKSTIVTCVAHTHTLERDTDSESCYKQKKLKEIVFLSCMVLRKARTKHE